jgi:hypothetical protein
MFANRFENSSAGEVKMKNEDSRMSDQGILTEGEGSVQYTSSFR